MDQPGLRRELIGRGYSWSAQFTWARAVEATWDAYQELL
jgi:hypothetical protein